MMPEGWGLGLGFKGLRSDVTKMRKTKYLRGLLIDSSLKKFLIDSSLADHKSCRSSPKYDGTTHNTHTY
jgi:hypothetical protein